MLALGIRYLNGFVAASAPDDREEPEWPPHPGRVFMALAAAHFETGGEPAERRALLWLEGLGTNGEPPGPEIAAQGATARAGVTQYVPVNDDNAGCKRVGKKVSVFQEIGQTGLRRNRQGRTFARAWLEDDTAYLLWPEVTPDEPVRSCLQGLCRKVTRIGHSTSLVQVWLADPDEAPEPTWIPDDDRAEIYLRMAAPGTLEQLERMFNGAAADEFAALSVAASDPSGPKTSRAAKRRLKDEFDGQPPTRLRPQLAAYQGYARPDAAVDEPTAAGTVFDPHLIVLRLERADGPLRHLDLACTLQVTSRWRDALLSRSNDLSEAARSILSGHDAEGRPLESPHLAFLPLGFVGHPQADGHLLGMAAVLPRSLATPVRRDVLRALARVRELKLGRLGCWRLDSVTESHPPVGLRAPTWTAHPRGATEWSTVTPFVLDRHPKSREPAAYREEVATVITRACARVGLPAPSHVVVTPVSAHLGTPASHDYPRLHRKDGSQRRHTHAILIFDQPVRGPILIGAGRYRGYGVCRAIGGTEQ